MAGDWIKIEKSTGRKPEVLLMADLLGVTRREAIGLLYDYFCWVDDNLDESRNGLVTHVSRKVVEEALQCAGLAAMLERMGWASFDDEACTMTVAHWERHNGNSAKTRALGQQRAKRFRDAHRNDSVTQTPLPEKRREELSTSLRSVEEPLPIKVAKPGKQNRATRLAADWYLPDEWRDWVVTVYKIDPQEAVRISLAFKDWFLQVPGADGTSLDWRRRWQVWVRREMERKHARLPAVRPAG